MTATATIDPAGGVHVLDDRRVSARFPLIISRMMRTGVAATANLAGQFPARAHRQIHFVCRVIRRRSMAILALHTRQLRGV